MRKIVTLYTPELRERVKYLAAQGAPLPTGGLALWLSKGRSVKSEPLFKGGNPLSAAALLATANGYPKGKPYCLASPIHCHADQQTVYIIDKAQLDNAEEQAMLTTLNRFLQEDDIQLERLNNGLWLFSMKHHTEVNFSDISTVAGKSMGRFLPTGSDAVYWRRLLTECQMLLSQTLSVWFWGNGIDNVQLTTPFDRVFTNDAILQAQAFNAGVNTQALPAQYRDLQLNTANPLLADKRFTMNADLGPAESLSELCQFEQAWIEPLIADLQQGRVDSLTLVIDAQTSYTLKKSQLRFFWRKLKPLTAFFN